MEFLCTDAAGVPRGRCSYSKCSSWQLAGHEEVHFKQAAPRQDHSSRNTGAVCEVCGCTAEQHVGLQEWHAKARHWVQRLVTRDGRWPPEVPVAFQLPAAAQDWDPVGAALYIVTNGQFDPHRDGRRAITSDQRQLISLICPSIERYHVHHPLLYDCFRKQTHGDCELIVVDSGTTPSEFMQEVAQKDKRIVYRFFFRGEHGPEREEDPLERVRREDDAGEVIEWKFVPWTDAEKAEVRWEGFAMSLGLKRNIACFLSQGSAIMHFNAGDVYSPSYAGRMFRELGLPSEAREVPLTAAALGEWHGLDLPAETFRRLDFRKKDLVSEEKRERIQLGRGFTLAYTRPAWEKVPFLDDEEPEGRFMKTLQLLSHLRVVQPSRQDTLAAHSYDYASSSGANAAASINISGEIRDFIEHSEPMPTPSGFSDLMPAVRKLAALANRKREEEVKRLLQLEGSAYFCNKCDAAVALKVSLMEVHRVGNPEGGSCMVGQFLRAGGAVAEGEKIFEDPKPLTPVQQFTPLLGGFGATRGLLGIPTQKQLCPNWKTTSLGLGGLQGQAPGLRSVLQPLAKASQELSWFPGWSRRVALCRRCGSTIGRRYEQKETGVVEATIFWALDLKFLKEREAPQVPLALQDQPAKAKAKAKAKIKPKDRQPEPELQTPVSPLLSRHPNREPTKVKMQEKLPEPSAHPSPAVAAPVPERKEEAAPEENRPAPQLQPEGGASAKPPCGKPDQPAAANAPEVPLSAADKKARDAASKASAAIRSLSPDLQEQLATGLATADKSKFDLTLNSLKIDTETRRILLVELQVRPGLAALQLEQLVAKAFKTRINMLRSLGIKVIRSSLEEVLPERIRKVLSSSGGEDGSRKNPVDSGLDISSEKPRQLEPKQENVALPPQPPARLGALAAPSGGGDEAFDFDALEALDPSPEAC